MIPRVAILILNWNNAPDTIACLESLGAVDYPACRVLVVDNGSTDGSVAAIRAAFPEVEILETGENLGYAGGNNVGIRYALERGAEYVWLLNDDVTVAPESLSILVAVALSNRDAAFLGPKICMTEEPQRILSAGRIGFDGGHRGLGELDRGQFDQIAEVDHLSGCALLVRREAIERIGMLDEDFFAYEEDVEWCYRGKRAGFKVLFVPQAKVWHPDTRRRDPDSPLVTYYMSRNHLLFMKKLDLGTLAILRTLGLYVMRVFNWSIRPKWRHKKRQRDALLKAIWDFGRGRYGRAEELS